MKKLSVVIFSGILICSCSDSGTGSKEVVKDSASAMAAPVKMDYPYTIDHPDNWDMGSPENTMVALSSLKAYEAGNIDECIKYVGDSINLQFDGLDIKITKDSLKTILTKDRGNLKSLTLKMYDWESVISKDKSEEFVTLWYKQSWEDLKGKKDSLSIVDDIKVKNAKIVEISETSRKFPARKM
ncbi:MAG: hypothetical protein ABI416_16560 [Ginsengibacter sp.]